MDTRHLVLTTVCYSSSKDAFPAEVAQKHAKRNVYIMCYYKNLRLMAYYGGLHPTPAPCDMPPQVVILWH
jgi:hypothetical protein